MSEKEHIEKSAESNPRQEFKALETHYNGYRFRSRLEARWAVFFDAARIKYRYEPQGFRLPEIGPYLPDFWIEIKAELPSSIEEAKAKALKKAHPDDSVYILVGQPWFDIASKLPEYQVWGPGDAIFTECFGCGFIDIRPAWHPNYTIKQELALQCMYCDCVDRNWNMIAIEANGWEWHKGDWQINPGGTDPRCSPRLMSAYSAARSARFEHGETPKVES